MTERKGHGRPVGTGEVTLAGSTMSCPCHVCTLYRDVEEQYALFVPFVKEGIKAGERVVSFVAPDEHEERVNRLWQAGLDVDRLERQGQLVITPWDQFYLSQGYFDVDAMLALAQAALDEGLRQGFPRTRGWANMEWALEEAPGVEHLAIYESRFNDILSLCGDGAVCAYDVSRFSADVLEDVTRAHPQLCAGGWAGSHPLYEPPETLVPELESRLS